eukprot:TRINITY_DN4724_c1_g1_i2.p1 TRINITY_DN4724_c1_g1~~TRINITY_DN4724_c1_g1_i2.p1  ORF type:complete len:163 (+),score=29.04 TRINITY_DN4724_c1_g1_i2:164-652(+)
MAPQVGDQLPDATLWENNPDGAVKIRELFAGKKGVIFAVPGAFTPTCSNSHLPSYIEKYDELVAAGVEVIVCVSVNDPFVMAAWGEKVGATGKVRMLSDKSYELTKPLGMELDATPKLGNVRSQRYSMIVVDNVIKVFNLEENPGATACSLAPNILEQIKTV